jgi:hypothetical protein
VPRAGPPRARLGASFLPGGLRLSRPHGAARAGAARPAGPARRSGPAPAHLPPLSPRRADRRPPNRRRAPQTSKACGFKMAVLALIHLNGGQMELGAAQAAAAAPRARQLARAKAAPRRRASGGGRTRRWKPRCHGLAPRPPTDRPTDCCLRNPPRPLFLNPLRRAAEVWRHLKMLGAAEGDAEHPLFGRSEDLLRDLEKTRWGFVWGAGPGFWGRVRESGPRGALDGDPRTC